VPGKHKPGGASTQARAGAAADTATETIGPKSSMPWPARFAVLSDTHLAPAGTHDREWNYPMRLSASHDLLRAAVAEIAAAGLRDVLLLGDLSDRGDQDTIAAALGAVASAGLHAWAVPGNHDVSVLPDALTQAAGRCSHSTVISQGHLAADLGIALCGHRLRSDDGGQTCEAIDVPDPAGLGASLLVWASHYPVLSQRGRFRAAGLRYPGDLRNLSYVAGRIARFHGPILILHGHLHAAAVKHSGPALQVGVPAAVEWPHAWTAVTVQSTPTTAAVEATIKSIPGPRPTPAAPVTLARPTQNWAYSAGRWTQRLAAER
jgi:hypothetical protein